MGTRAGAKRVDGRNLALCRSKLPARARSIVAGDAGPEIGGRRSRGALEVVVPTRRMQRELEGAERAGDASRRIRHARRFARIGIAPARPHYEADGTGRIGGSARALGIEPLVIMVVPLQDHVDAIALEERPELGIVGAAAVLGAAGEARLVPVGQEALLAARAPVGKILREPGVLRRTALAVGCARPRREPGRVADRGVEDDDVPGTRCIRGLDIVAVPAVAVRILRGLHTVEI